MKTISDIQKTLQVRFRRSKFAWLEAYAKEECFSPLEYPLGIPTQRDASMDVRELDRWISQWKNVNIQGAEVLWKTVHWSWMGGERLVPEKLRLESLEGFLTCMDSSGQVLATWRRAQGRIDRMKSLNLSYAAQALAFHGISLLDDTDEEFERLIAVGRWLLAHYPANSFVREIPVEGVDTKWLEKHKRAVTIILTNETEYLFTAANLFDAWGFKKIPATVRVRHAQVFVPGIPPEEMVQLPASILRKSKPRALVVIENIQTGLSIDVPEDVPVLMGMGFGLDILKDIPWLKNVPIYYFGDLDVHGVAILSNLRRNFSHVKSFLMDLETFEHWKSFAVNDPTKNVPLILSKLNKSEQELFKVLFETSLRLEQERIPLEVINQAVMKIFD